VDNCHRSAGLARMLVKHNVTRLRRGSLCCGSQGGKLDNFWGALHLAVGEDLSSMAVILHHMWVRRISVVWASYRGQVLSHKGHLIQHCTSSLTLNHLAGFDEVHLLLVHGVLHHLCGFLQGRAGFGPLLWRDGLRPLLNALGHRRCTRFVAPFGDHVGHFPEAQDAPDVPTAQRPA